MAGNSLESILTWMKSEPRLLGWGLIVALERRKTNLLVIQEYIRRFGTASYLPPIEGGVVIVENKRTEYIHDFVVDAPRLSFENADIDNSKAQLSMTVVGGSQLTLDRTSVGWTTVAVGEIDPLQGPKLYLDLNLNEVPGDVDADGRVILDLSKSDDFRLTFATSAHEQRMGGDFFKDLFNKLPDDKRIYPIGKIEPGTNELMRPKSFELRTQSSGLNARDSQSAEYGDGAILALVRTMSSHGGNFPGSGYKYLIPDDPAKNYSATILFENRMVAVSVLLAEVANMLGDNTFNYAYEAGELISVMAESGAIKIAGDRFDVPIQIDEIGVPFMVDASFSDTEFSVKSPGLFIIDTRTGKVSLRFKSALLTRVDFFYPDILPPFTVTVSVSFDLLAEYQILEVDGGISLKRTDYKFDNEISYSGQDALGTRADTPPYWELTLNELLKDIQRRIIESHVVPRLERAFQNTILVEPQANTLIKESIKLNFGQSIQGDEIRAPLDVGFFGQINPSQTAFVVTPLEHLMSHGSTQQFTTEPAVAGLKWRVENVEGAEVAGTIGELSGLYQAPVVAAIHGRFTRVRVTATAPDTGYYSSALVSVLANNLTVNPLIQICMNSNVELSAGSLGEGALSWAIKNPVVGESGTVIKSDNPGGDHTYKPGPVVSSKTYVLDEVEVTNGAGQTCSVHVLALQKQPMLTVIIDRIDLMKGEVQLTALFDGLPEAVEWRLAIQGPGSISATGLYLVDPTATSRFVLVYAELPFGSRLLEGHLILPLPLVEFPKLLDVLTQ